MNTLRSNCSLTFRVDRVHGYQRTAGSIMSGFVAALSKLTAPVKRS